MNERWLKLKTWWAGLAEREQKMLTMGGLVVTAAVFYGLIWSPYLSYVSELRKRIKADQSTLVYMQALDHKIQEMQKQEKPHRQNLDSISFLTELQKQVEKSGLQQNLLPLKQTSQDAIQMHFQHVEFDKLILFMMQVIQNYQLTITQLNATKEPSAGIVSADLTVKRG